MPKVNLRTGDSADPRLGYDSTPDPKWWEDRAESPDRSGYGHEANLDRVGAMTKQRPDIEELFDMALSGMIPRSRDLKTYEPDKLNPRHLQILLMRAAGASNGRIAAEVGVTDTTVSIVCNHPDGQFILARILMYAAENIVDVEAQLKAAAPGITTELLREFTDPGIRKETKIKLGFGLLDRAGYGGTQKQESTVRHEFVVPEKSAGLLSEAIREAQQIDDADYVIIPAEDGLPGGSEEVLWDDQGSVGGPEAPFGSATDVNAPPVSGSQVSPFPDDDDEDTKSYRPNPVASMRPLRPEDEERMAS